MDLPVIMMSADDGKSVVMKGVTHGACDYLIKPVRIEALKNIWQHVIRKKRNEDEEADERDDTSTLKKPRVVWSVELHQQFVAAVDQLGIDKAVPRKILELMNVPGLTRENVASHLQKYRLYLRRLSGVSHHQNNMNNSFLSPQETLFGAISSINGIDLQTLAATGQLPAQSLATLQAAGLGRSTAKAGVSMPLLDQRNLFSFENPRLRFGEGQQQHLSTSKPMNLLRGIPTIMEPKQLANLHQSTKSLGNLNTQVNTGIKGSGGFPCNDIFNELHHQKSQDWETTNAGLMYDSSQHANPLQVNIDVSPSVLVHQGYSSTQQNGQSRDAPLIGKTIFSLGEGLELGDLQNAGQLLIPLLVDNSVRVKTERVPDASSQNNLFSEHYGQEDLMSALLKQVIHIYTYIRKNVIGRGDSTKNGQPDCPAEISHRQNRWIFRFSFLCFLALLLFLVFILIKKKEGSVFDLRQTMASAF